ncbi:unnamed protein product [Amaranthus hypochondriacus]
MLESWITNTLDDGVRSTIEDYDVVCDLWIHLKQRLGHTKDDCHQLKGYPDWWDENRKGERCRDRGGLVSEP